MHGHAALLASLLALGLAADAALALPTGNQLVAGSATLSSPTPSSLAITQTSSKAIVNWQSFNIGAAESVQFIQPGAASVALNRVLGADPSAIYGSLTANGQVFLVNPNGILFGPTARVDVGGLVASTLNIANGDFLAGKLNFAGGSGSAINRGRLTAAPGGTIALLAPAVANAGTITAAGGSAALAAGGKVTLDFDGDNLLKLTVDASAVNAQVANSGAIIADGGRVVLTARAAGELLGSVIQNSGSVAAKSMVKRNGQIVLDAGEFRMEGGSVEASGGEFKIGGSLLQSGGSFSPGQARISVGGAWDTRGGQFIPGGSTVEINDASQVSTIYGDNSFYNFVAATPAKKLNFAAGKTQTVLGDFKLEGGYGQLLEVRSTDPGGEQWNLNPLGTTSARFVHLGDARSLGPTSIKALPSNSYGNNTGWDTDPVWNGAGADNNWSTNGNWDTGVKPGAADTVTFDATSSKDSTVDGGFAGTITNLYLNAGYAGTLSLARSLAVSESFAQAAGSLNAANQALTIGNFNLSGGTFTSTSGIMTINADGAAPVAADMTISGGTFNHNSGTISMGNGSWERSGTLNTGAAVLNNLIIDKGTVSIHYSGTVNVAGDFTFITGADVWNPPGTVLFMGSGDQTINGGGGQFPSINIDKPSGTLTLQNTLRMSSGWTYTAGTVDAGSSTVIFNGGTIDSKTMAFNDVALASSGTIAITNTMNVNGNFTDTATNVLTGGTIAIKGNATFSDTTLDTWNDTAAITLNGTGAQTITQNAGAKPPMGTFTINKPSGTATLAADLSVNALSSAGVGQDLALTSGTLDLAGHNLTINDAFTIGAAGTLQLQGGETIKTPAIAAGGTVIYNGTAPSYTLKDWTYSNLSINGGNTTVFTLPDNKTVNTLTLNNSITSLAGKNLTATTLSSNDNATLRLQGDEAVSITTMDTAHGTVEYVGDGAAGLTSFNVKDFGATDYYKLKIAGDASETFHVASALKLNSTLTHTLGTLDLGASVTTAGGAISSTAPVSLSANVAIDTTSGVPAGASISFGDTVNADLAASNRTLALTAGSGDVAFSSAVGGSQALQSFTVNSANALSLAAVTTRASELATVTQDITLNGAQSAAGSGSTIILAAGATSLTTSAQVFSLALAAGVGWCIRQIPLPTRATGWSMASSNTTPPTALQRSPTRHTTASSTLSPPASRRA